MESALQNERPEASLNLSGNRRLPLHLQGEAAECGLACLAMIGGFHGHDIDLISLRRRFCVSSHGTTLKQLMDMASRLQLSGRALRVELEALSQLQLPCILHWDMNHFVVLKQVKGGRAVVYDPARGATTYTLAELGSHFTGVALELLPTQNFAATIDRQRLRISQLWSSITGLKRSLLLILLMALLLQLLAVASPFYLQTVVDDVLLRSDEHLLLVLALGFGLLLLIEASVGAMRQVVILSLSSRLNIQMAVNVFRHLVRLPLDFFQKRHLGDVMSRFGSLESIRQLLTTGLVSALVDGLMAGVTLIVMFVYDARLTLLVLGVVAAYVAIRLLLYPASRRLTEESLAAAAQTETSFMESIRAIQTLKLHQKEQERQSLWQNRLASAMNKGIALEKLNIVHSTSDVLLFGAGRILVIYLGAKAVMAGAMSIGMLYAFMSFKQRFMTAIDGFVEQMIQFKMLGVHLERLSDIALSRKEAIYEQNDNESDVKPVDAVKQCGTTPQQLHVERLSYRYGEADEPVLKNLTLSINANECVAITGPSGTGKSTLLKCMMGLLHPQEGEISWAGRPVATDSSYRASVAAVMQDDQLLSGSIANNIACFDHDVDHDWVVQCARLACIHDDIENLPMRYNTLVGDMGSSLSGGQVQRIMLARALYRRPVLLFMDEATSHLDIANERSVCENIAALRITRIFVAHRPETIRTADRVIELGS